MERALYRARKFGPERAAELDRNLAAIARDEEIPLALDRIARTPNTRKAHQLIAFATAQERADAVVEALFRAYFAEGRDIGDDDTLVRLATAAGLQPGPARAALRDADLRSSVVAYEAEAARMGVAGVPFFVVDGRLGVSGAQPASRWRDILRQAMTGAEPSTGSPLSD